MNLIKVLWCRFQQCLGTFTMLLVEGSSGTGLFRHLHDYVFRVRNFGQTKSMTVIFSFEIFKIYSRCQKGARNSEKAFCFSDKCIWIGIVKFSLIRIEYFSSAANVLTLSAKIWYVNNRDFSWLNWLCTDQWIT